MTELREAGLGGTYGPVSLVENIIDTLHYATGMPWWATIIAFGAATKLVFLPLSIRQSKAQLNAAYVKPELEEIQRKQQLAMQSGNREEAALQSLHLRKIQAARGANPVKMLLPALIPAPFYFASFMAMRSIAAANLPSLSSGGALWFTNLAVADPLFILPVLSSIFMIANSRLSNENGMQTHLSQAIIYSVALITIPITSQLASVVTLYFVTFNCMNLVSTLVLKIRPIRRYLGIPDPVVDRSRPKESFFQAMKRRYLAFIQSTMPAADKVPQGPVRVIKGRM